MHFRITAAATAQALTMFLGLVAVAEGVKKCRNMVCMFSVNMVGKNVSARRCYVSVNRYERARSFIYIAWRNSSNLGLAAASHFFILGYPVFEIG